MVMQGLKETKYWFLIPVHVLSSYTRKPTYNGTFFPREKFRWTVMRLFLHSRQIDACLARYSLTFIPQYRKVEKKKSLIGDPQVPPGHRETFSAGSLKAWLRYSLYLLASDDRGGTHDLNLPGPL